MASKNARNFEFKLGKQALVLFILGMSLLLFCVFLFGVMVGKHIDAYPEIVARGIPGMIRDKLGFGKEKTPGVAAAEEENEDGASAEQDDFGLTFYDTLAKKGAGNGARQVKAGKETPKAAAAVPGVATGTAPRDAAGNAPGRAPGMAVDKRAAPGVPGDADSLPAGGRTDEGAVKKSVLAGDAEQAGSGVAAARGYIIHVASFREKARSDQLAKKLAARGCAASVEARDLPGKGKWFRVVVNGLKTREEARKVLNDVETHIKGLKATILAVGEKRE